jgi:hypothetical protein
MNKVKSTIVDTKGDGGTVRRVVIHQTEKSADPPKEKPKSDK